MIFSKIISASGAACWVLYPKRNLQSWYEKWRKAVSKTQITKLKFRVYPNPPVLLTAVQDYDCWVIFCLFNGSVEELLETVTDHEIHIFWIFLIY